MCPSKKDSAGIIVLNGWAASAHAWDQCEFMKTAAPDGGVPTLYSYVDQLAGLPEQAFATGRRFIVVGWSMGGSTALRLACLYPAQIAGLVLLAATPRMMEDKASGWKGMSQMRLDALKRGLEITQGQGLFGIPDGHPSPYIMDDPENLENGLRYLQEIDLREDLERVFCGGCEFPVHIFQSEYDGIVRSANVDYLKRIFPNACVNIFSGSEHVLPFSVPEVIDRTVKAIML